MKNIASFATIACVLAAGALAGCYDDEPVRPTHTGASTVVVSSPGVASPQAPAPPATVVQAPAQPAPPVVNNIVQPAPTAAPPAASPAPAPTINVQPRTVTVP
ncbi:MAG TPA: hypothetical protein VH044_05615 [Polyangiaceae bacterium]|jgi:hypothetical protein|nr:hypothetical protein [Polyangiaceae bacterium]